MGKTYKGREKTAAKIAKAKRKIARKCKAASAIVLFLGIALAMCGCTSAKSDQPAKSQTQHNEFHDNTIIVAAAVKLPKSGTNAVVEADGGNLPPLELFTQTQALESSGTESFAQANTQTPTTDVKPDIDANYNDAVKSGGDLLSSLTAESASLLRSYMSGRKSGAVTVTKSDGTTDTVTCRDGICTFSDGSVCSDGSCSSR